MTNAWPLGTVRLTWSSAVTPPDDSTGRSSSIRSFRPSNILNTGSRRAAGYLKLTSRSLIVAITTLRKYCIIGPGKDFSLLLTSKEDLNGNNDLFIESGAWSRHGAYPPVAEEWGCAQDDRPASPGGWARSAWRCGAFCDRRPGRRQLEIPCQPPYPGSVCQSGGTDHRHERQAHCPGCPDPWPLGPGRWPAVRGSWPGHG